MNKDNTKRFKQQDKPFNSEHFSRDKERQAISKSEFLKGGSNMNVELIVDILSKLFERSKSVNVQDPQTGNIITKKSKAFRESPEEKILMHLQGKHRIGVSPWVNNDEVIFAAVDLDLGELPEEERQKYTYEIYSKLRELGFKPFIEKSKSKGYHIWIPFSKPVNAKAVIWLLERVRQTSSYPYKSKIEILPPKKTCLFLPLFSSLTDNNEISPEFLETLHNAILKPDSLEKPLLNWADYYQDFAAENTRTLEFVDKLKDLPPCFLNAYENWQEGYRNNYTFGLAGVCKSLLKLPEDEALKIILSIARARNDEELSLREHVIRSTYSKETVAGCSILKGENEEISVEVPVCSEDCPYAKKNKEKIPRYRRAWERIHNKVTVYKVTDDDYYLLYDGRFYELRSSLGRDKLQKLVYESIGEILSKDELEKLLTLLRLEYSNSPKGKPLPKRVTWKEENRSIYFNAGFYVVEINEHGFRVLPHSSVNRFRYVPIQTDLPKIDESYRGRDVLERFLKYAPVYKDEDAFILDVVRLITLFIPDISKPIAIYIGPQGAGKTKRSLLNKLLYDPTASVMESINSRNRDGNIVNKLRPLLDSNVFLVLDNLSSVSQELSDFLCRAITGGTESTRRLYTDRDLDIVQLKGTFDITAIDLNRIPPDLLDRSLIIELERINRNKRLEETALTKAFEKEIPFILPAIFNVISDAIKLYLSVRNEYRPVHRLSSWSYWAIAISRSVGVEKEVIRAINRGSKKLILKSLEQIEPILPFFYYLIEERFKDKLPITKKTSEWLKEVVNFAKERGYSFKTNSRKFGKCLNKSVPLFKELGYNISLTAKSSGNYRTISKVESDNPEDDRLDIEECSCQDIPHVKSLKSNSSSSSVECLNVCENPFLQSQNLEVEGISDRSFSGRHEREKSGDELSIHSTPQQKVLVSNDLRSGMCHSLESNIKSQHSTSFGFPKNYVISDEHALRILRYLKNARKLYLDVVLSADSLLRLISIGDGNNFYVFDVQELSNDIVRSVIALIPGKLIVGYKLKHILKALASNYGREILPDKTFDVYLAEKLLWNSWNPERATEKALSFHSLAKKYTKTSFSKVLPEFDFNGDLTPSHIDYVLRRVEMLSNIAGIQVQLLNSLSVEHKGVPDELELINPVAQLEGRFLPILVEMELAGIPVNEEFLKDTVSRAEREFKTLHAELKEELGVNPQSAQKVLKILKSRYGLEVESVSKAELCKYREHPVVAKLLKLKNLKKLINAEQFLKTKGGRLYPEFSQLESHSGRMSARDPNVQQIPRELKKNFYKAPKGRVIIRADYPAIELRLAAKIAHDKRMIQAFQKREDLHTLTAFLISGKPVNQITPEERQRAKAVNFGFLYGMSAETFKKYAFHNYGVRLTDGEAKEFRRKFFKAYPGIVHWHRLTEQELKSSKSGIVRITTLYGRVVAVDTLTKALNVPVQGSGADLLKLAAARFRILCKEENLDAQIINLIHDEIVVETSADHLAKAKELLKRAMEESALELIGEFPTPVEVEVVDGETVKREGEPC